MTEKSKTEFRVNSPSSVPSCADPNHLFSPKEPNNCKTCWRFGDFSCWDYLQIILELTPDDFQRAINKARQP